MTQDQLRQQFTDEADRAERDLDQRRATAARGQLPAGPHVGARYLGQSPTGGALIQTRTGRIELISVVGSTVPPRYQRPTSSAFAKPQGRTAPTTNLSSLALDLLPIVGTIRIGQRTIKNPNPSNIALLTASVALDVASIFGVGLAGRAALGSSRAAATAVRSGGMTAREIQGLERYAKAQEAAHRANMLSRDRDIHRLQARERAQADYVQLQEDRLNYGSETIGQVIRWIKGR